MLLLLLLLLQLMETVPCQIDETEHVTVVLTELGRQFNLSSAFASVCMMKT